MNIFEDGFYEVGGEIEYDESFVFVFVNSYLGFFLDLGKGIVFKDEIIFVFGVFRVNYSGVVVLLKRDMKFVYFFFEYIFDGEGLVFLFGYDVVVVDFNKDGW